MAGKDTWEVLDSRRSLTIVAAGRTGMGKSALINGLVGADFKVAKESGETLDHQTDQLTSYTTEKRSIRITIWDAPGLEIARTPEELEVRIQDMEQKVREVDLLMYCTRMDEHRLRPGDTQTIRVLTKAFGEVIWKNAVFVLTFANKVEVPKSKAYMVKETYFEERLAQWKRDLQKEVKAIGVTNEVATAIPVIPAGYYNEPQLPNRQNWLSDFWHVCFETIKERAQPALLEANLERLKAKDEISQSHFEWPINRQPIEDRSGITRTAAGGIAGSAALGGLAGFVVGGTVGAVTGLGVGAIGGTAAYAIHRHYYRNN